MYRKIVKYLEIGLVAVFVIGLSQILYWTIVYPETIKSDIKPGMNKRDVLERYQGKTYTITQKLFLCEYRTWQGDCNEQTLAKSKEFLVIKTGIDGYFAIGFDKRGRVNYLSNGES